MKQTTKINNSPGDLLKKAGLKVTKNREELIQVLQNSHKPLSHQEIMELLPTDKNWDRVTIYRALSDLEEKNIIKTLLSGDRVTFFELKETIHHSENHAHLVCDICSTVECVSTISGQLPFQNDMEFEVLSVEMVLRGKCKSCQVK
jgi:Fur family ferric uptake transcriptional regulator